MANSGSSTVVANGISGPFEGVLRFLRAVESAPASKGKVKLQAVAGKKILQFKRELVDSVVTGGDLLTDTPSEGLWEELRAVHREAEREQRLLELDDETGEAFTKAVWWMAENGQTQDVPRLRQALERARVGFNRVETLIETAIERIETRSGLQGERERDQSPKEAMTEAYAAYDAHKAEWDQEYAGQFIVVLNGAIIDADSNEDALHTRIYDRQRREGAFQAVIIPVGAPTIVARGPRIRPGPPKK